MQKYFFSTFFKLLLFTTLLLPLCRAQQVFGTIDGTVTDHSGAAVPAAAVTITDTM